MPQFRLPVERSAESQHLLRFRAAVAVFVACVVASAIVGEPTNKAGEIDLPDVALGWDVLFHLLRASAVLGATGTVLLIAWRGARGEWPIRFGNVEYAPREAIEVTADVIAKLNERVELMESRLDDARVEGDGPED
jgi:hypothetical protein